jgi:hypothetical protein
MRDKLWMKLAWLLPKQLIYWSLVRAFAQATTGPYSDTVAGELTVFQVQERWG